jgi:hypothetical protein
MVPAAILVFALLLSSLGPIGDLAARLGGAGMRLGLSSSAADPGPAPPVAIDLRIADGRPDTLHLVAGRAYRIDQINLIARDERPDDDGLNALITRSSFAHLDWRGLTRAFADTVRGLDGVPFFQEIYRDAAWMGARHRLAVIPLDAEGRPTGPPVELESQADQPAIPLDAFPIRRPAVIREQRPAIIRAEALLQLRNASIRWPRPEETIEIGPATRSLLLAWEGEAGPRRDYTIPIEFVAAPAFGYGFTFDLDFAAPEPARGFAPGDEVEVVLTFRDGAGNRLHLPGSLPTYNMFRARLAGGLRYFDFQQGVLFFRDKNEEGVLLVALEGPVERARQIYHEVPASEFTGSQQVVALARRDGFTCLWQMVPPADVLFGGLADPRIWDTPISDRIRFVIPRDAYPGRYKIVGKARRVYLGESSLRTAVLAFDVHAGAPESPVAGPQRGDDATAPVDAATSRRRLLASLPPATGQGDPGSTPAGWVGRCENCHKTGVFPLAGLLHGNGDVETCAGCHAPLAFEPDNMMAYRVHYLHFFSRRSNVGPKTCRDCHIAPASIERASLLVCLSCHVTYHGGAEEYGNYRSCAFAECHQGAHEL